ncbi:MAG: DnaJ C-terminal domain-containing protein [Planctomycetota bacterium]
MSEDFYEILGVSRDASTEEIKRAYRKKAAKYHPDVSKEPDAAQRFQEATEAYEVLSDPEKRKIYDQFGHAGLKGEVAGAGRGPARGRPGGGAGTAVNFEDFFGGGHGFMNMGLDEILDALRGGGPGGAGTARRQRAPRGQDVEQHITLEFSEAIRGTQKTLRMRTADPQGRSHTETLDVKIPPGVDEGSKIRLRGKGQPGPGGNGDLYIIVHVRAHPYFRREGRDLYIDVPISLSEAALGARVDVPALDGTHTVTIPPGSRGNSKLRLRGQGVPATGKQAAGDMYIVLRVVPPKRLTEKGRELLEQFAEANPYDPREEAPWRR